jgi:hypothetical protein
VTRQRKRNLKRRIWVDQGEQCCWCECKIELSAATFEHLRPKVKGGSDGAFNMAIACKPCNRARGSRTSPRFTVARLAELKERARRRAEQNVASNSQKETAMNWTDNQRAEVLKAISKRLHDTHQGIPWEVIAKEVRPHFPQDHAPIGPVIAKFINDAQQKRVLPEPFATRFSTYKRSHGDLVARKEFKEWASSPGGGPPPPSNPFADSSAASAASEVAIDAQAARSSGASEGADASVEVVCVDTTETVLGWPLAVVGADRLIEDEELARRLGVQPASIDRLIDRLEAENKLGRILRHRVQKVGRGRPAMKRLLNERQAVKVTMHSEGKTADKIQDEIIDVFLAVKHGRMAPMSPQIDGAREAFRLLGWKTQEHDAKIAENERRILEVAETIAATEARVEAHIDARVREVEEVVVEAVTPVEQRVAGAERAVENQQNQIDELARRTIVSGAPKKRDGYMFVAELSRAVNMPSAGDGAGMTNDLIRILRGHERGMMVRAAMDSGLSAWTVAPVLQNEISALAPILMANFTKWNWHFDSGRLLPRFGVKPGRSINWIKMNEALPAVLAHVRGEAPRQGVLPLESKKAG